MISHEKLEAFICQYPVYQYAFFKPERLHFPTVSVGFVNRNVSVLERPGPVLLQLGR